MNTETVSLCSVKTGPFLARLPGTACPHAKQPPLAKNVNSVSLGFPKPLPFPEFCFAGYLDQQIP